MSHHCAHSGNGGAMEAERGQEGEELTWRITQSTLSSRVAGLPEPGSLPHQA